MAQRTRSEFAGDITSKTDTTGSRGTSGQDVIDLLNNLKDSALWYDEGLAAVLEDTTPQLGGNLDVNGNKIVSTSNGDIDIEPHGTGNVILGNFVFNADQTVGAGQDNYVMKYDHSTLTIGLEVETGGGSGGYTQAEIEDFAGGLFAGNTETLITATYQVADNTLDLVVENDLSLYDNTTSGFVTASTAPVTSVASKTGAVVLAATDLASGTLADARVAASNVTQHEASLSIATSQLTGTVGSSQLADESVTLTKFQHIATDSFLGRDTASTGDIEVLSASAVRTILNVEDGADVTDATNVTTALDGATVSGVTLTAPVINVGVTTDADGRTLALADASDVILMSSGSANIVTVPTNASVAFPVGTNITIVSTGAGTTSITGATGVTIQGNGGSASAGSCDIQTRYGAAVLIKIATDNWIVSGDIDGVA